MSEVPLPLPRGIADQLRPAGLEPREDRTSRSLLFDRGFGDGEDKPAFLRAFCGRFSWAAGGEHFAPFLARRRRAFDRLGARAVELTTASRLVVGLGLPHPVETGFLFDRLTGCPYLPASSVKGLLRAAARLAARGELEVGDEPERAADFFRGHLSRLFGPELAGGATPVRGELVVYDAFPTAWPALELDVLTPHHGEYYGDGGVPADWHQPVPVAFLTVAPKTTFRFHLRSLRADEPEADLGHAEALLRSALDWLGAGGKTAAGYGIFAAGAEDGGDLGEARPAPPQPPAPETLVWREATLRWLPGPGILQATQGNLQADSGNRELIDGLPEEVRNRLAPKKEAGKKRKKGKPVRCEVTVLRHSETWHEIVGLTP